MVNSKAWDWSKNTSQHWLEPSEESYYLAARWKAQGRQNVLDLGCGLGRHSVFFAKQGFHVSAFDLSEDGVTHLKDWAAREKLDIDAAVGDMLQLPYADASFDCLFAYHVISHTDSIGIQKIIAEIRRVLRPGGEYYLTLCSKETWSFAEAGYPKLDENTVVKTDEGPENGIPHFYVDLDNVLTLFSDFTLLSIRHTDDCWFNGTRRNSKHYFILGSKPPEN